MRACEASIINQQGLKWHIKHGYSQLAITIAMAFSGDCTTLAIERPKDFDALTSDEIIAQKNDPQVAAYIGLGNVKLVVDQEALARLAHAHRRHAAPAIRSEYTLILLDALLEAEDTPVEPPPPGDRKELPSNRSPALNKVDPGPPTHHDLNILSGRAAFMLERLYDIKLPPSTKTDTVEQRQELQRDAIRQILLAKMRNELAVVPKLDEAERVRLARDPWTSPAVLEILAEDPSTKVLFALVDERGIPASAYRKFRERLDAEKDPEVKKQLRRATLSNILSPIDATPNLKKVPSAQEQIEQAWDLIEAKKKKSKAE